MNRLMKNAGKIFRLCLFLVSFGLGSSVYAAELKPDGGPFIPYADEFASAVVMMPKTHQILYSFKPDMPRVAASFTKLANALVFVSLPPRWGRVVSITKADEVGGGRLRVAVSARLTVRDLFYSSLAASANNAATALARVSGMGKSAFLLRMNQTVKKLGARHTVFFDASGMNTKNKTTARDIALIAEQAFANPDIRAAVTAGEYRFALIGTKQEKLIKSTNPLLTSDPDVWVVGGKTGYLQEAKYNFLAELQPIGMDGSGDPTKDLIVVVMGAPTKSGAFASAKRLAEWAWQNHEFLQP